jgi:hypothetical protein
MSPLAKLLLMYVEEYQAEWVGKEFAPPMTAQAYARARLMNEFDEALNDAMMYAETNGGLR